MFNAFILNKGRKDAVLVKTQLYSVISVNKLGSGGGFMGNNLGMAYLNTKYQKRYHVSYFLQKRYLKSTADTRQSVYPFRLPYIYSMNKYKEVEKERMEVDFLT